MAFSRKTIFAILLIVPVCVLVIGSAMIPHFWLLCIMADHHPRPAHPPDCENAILSEVRFT